MSDYGFFITLYSKLLKDQINAYNGLNRIC